MSSNASAASRGEQTSTTRELVAIAGRMLWPDEVAVSDDERTKAAGRITQARLRGVLTHTQADQRLSRLPTARTRADLHAELDGLPGTQPTRGLLTACRVTTALWLGSSAVQFVVWMLIAVISLSWDDPWWLWTVVIGGAAAAALWWLTETEHRMCLSGGDERIGDLHA